MKIFQTYLKYKKKLLIMLVIFAVILFISLSLYQLPLSAVLYPFILCLVVGIIFMVSDYRAEMKKQKELERMSEASYEIITDLPAADSLTEQACHDIIGHLCDSIRDDRSRSDERYRHMIDYYTVWAHQIKTPIAAMKINIENEDSAFSRKMKQDLIRIEQYVDMVLTFLRLESESTDYVFRECDLDSIVKPVVRKYAGEFIGRKLQMNYSPLLSGVMTDDKWLAFVVEQVISNALKYTKTGSISIFMSEPEVLCIKDTGIGIMPQDLPRVFENGYTGYNGRTDKRASGIGLYLCKRICDNLGHKISITSEVDKGTCVYIDMTRYRGISE